jgi:hypothetical protein
MAFDGHLLLTPGQQREDAAHFTAEEAVSAEALSLEWLRHAATRAREKVRAAGHRELVFVTHAIGEEKGVGGVARGALAGLARNPWFAAEGMGFSEWFVKRVLDQVRHYSKA